MPLVLKNFPLWPSGYLLRVPESSFPGTLRGGLWGGWRQNFINYGPTLVKNKKGKVEKASKTLKSTKKWEQKHQLEDYWPHTTGSPSLSLAPDLLP